MTQDAAAYAFPHANSGESRRLDLFAERLDPATKRRIGQLGLGPAARCLEVGGGRGSITRWLVVEEPDFGMWLADLDPTWAAHPAAALHTSAPGDAATITRSRTSAKVHPRHGPQLLDRRKSKS